MDNYPPGALNDSKAPFNQQHIDHCYECAEVTEFDEQLIELSNDKLICTSCLRKAVFNDNQEILSKANEIDIKNAIEC